MIHQLADGESYRTFGYSAPNLSQLVCRIPDGAILVDRCRLADDDKRGQLLARDALAFVNAVADLLG